MLPHNEACRACNKKRKFCKCNGKQITERTVVLVPVRDTITKPTTRCLEQRFTDGEVEVLVEVGKPVDIARNELTKRVLALPDRPRYVIWADADAVWTSGTFDRLRGDIRKLDNVRSLIGVLHGPRSVGAEAHVMKVLHPSGGTPIQWGIDYPKAQNDPSALVQVVFLGAHMLAHDIRLFDALPSNPWSPRVGECSEDFGFIMRVHEAKGSVWCDTACPVFHFDEEAGYGYLPGHFPPFTFGSEGQRCEVPDDGTGWAHLRRTRKRSYGELVDSHMLANKIRATAMVR